MKEKISLTDARKIILASQCLSGSVLDPLEIIEHLGYVQIDTISVVERAHHHVIWARNNKYKSSDLDTLVSSRDVFEYWSHAASFLPMRDYRFTLPMKNEFRKKENSWFPRDLKMMNLVLKRIRDEGPLRSKDFKATKKGATGWWDWKPAKQALERLFMEGSLEVSRREGFQKVYDLPENVIPNFSKIKMPSQKEYVRFLIDRTLRHQGLANVSEIAYLRKSQMKHMIEEELKDMVIEKNVVELSVQGLEGVYFAHAKTLSTIPRASSRVLILSPFDNLVIQRKKLFNFFNFDYQIECYVPEKKRQFGYFCLPIFKGVLPVARIDCKANRKSNTLEILSIHYESGIKKTDIHEKIKTKLASFAKFNNCQVPGPF